MTPTILAVDDDRSILGLIDTVLSSAGYRVLLADGGWRAIEIFEQCPDPIHLLVTDVIMPDLTGPVVAERLSILCLIATSIWSILAFRPGSAANCR